MRSLSIGATGMLAQQLNVEVISHNIANMNTTAYTRRRVNSRSTVPKSTTGGFYLLRYGHCRTRRYTSWPWR